MRHSSERRESRHEQVAIVSERIAVVKVARRIRRIDLSKSRSPAGYSDRA